MVSGFFTSPCDQVRMSSEVASEMLELVETIDVEHNSYFRMKHQCVAAG